MEDKRTPAASSSSAAGGGKKNASRKKGGAGGGGGGGNNNTTTNSNRRNKNRRRNKDRRNQNPQGGTTARGPPQTPQLKVTIRNVGNAERYGTIEDMTELVHTLVNRANDVMPTDSSSGGFGMIQVDQISAERLILEGKAAAAAAKKLAVEQSNALERVESTEDEDNAENAGDGTEGKKDSDFSDVPPAVDELAEIEAKLSALVQQSLKPSDATPSVEKSFVTARALYVQPPRKTRRRGEKPGCAYILLVAPPLEAKPRPAPESGKGGDAAASSGSATNCTNANKPPAVDYSREVAKRRLVLARAVEAMAQVAEQDAKSRQDLMGCVVEESLNVKAWKPNHRRDRLDGTVEQTEDFKEFLAEREREKEERMARPKPAPGGGGPPGTAAAGAVGTVATGENGEPVAAIVLHLRAKMEEEKKRKKAKRKAKEATKKAKSKDSTGGTGNNSNSNNKSSDGGGGGGGSGKKKKQNKKRGARPRNGSKVAIKSSSSPG